MGEQLFACLDIVYALDNLTVNGSEAVSHSVDTLGRMERDSLVPEFELGALALQASLCGKAHGLPKSLESGVLFADGILCSALQSQVEFGYVVGLFLQCVDELFGSRCRRLDGGMHHHVHHADIARVAYARNDGQWEIGAMEG